jgi:hypothetical protein
MIKEIKRIIKESEIMKEDDAKWPQKNKDGRQELEIRMGNEHISFETAKIGSLVDVQESSDPEGLRVFYYLVQDLKALVFSLIALHFKVGKPDCVGRESGLTNMHRNIDQAHINNYDTQPPTSYLLHHDFYGERRNIKAYSSRILNSTINGSVRRSYGGDDE